MYEPEIRALHQTLFHHRRPPNLVLEGARRGAGKTERTRGGRRSRRGGTRPPRSCPSPSLTTTLPSSPHPPTMTPLQRLRLPLTTSQRGNPRRTPPTSSIGRESTGFTLRTQHPRVRGCLRRTLARSIPTVVWWSLGGLGSLWARYPCRVGCGMGGTVFRLAGYLIYLIVSSAAWFSKPSTPHPSSQLANEA